MTFGEHIPVFLPAAAFVVLLAAFDLRLDARGDFMVCLGLTEVLAWLLSYGMGRCAAARLGKQPGWVRAGWLACVTVLMVFPLGTLAFGVAGEVCALYRDWTGRIRPISADFFFQDFSGIGLGNGLQDGWRNVGVAALVGVVTAVLWAPALFLLAACCRGLIGPAAERGGGMSHATQ